MKRGKIHTDLQSNLSLSLEICTKRPTCSIRLFSGWGASSVYVDDKEDSRVFSSGVKSGPHTSSEERQGSRADVSPDGNVEVDSEETF